MNMRIHIVGKKTLAFAFFLAENQYDTSLAKLFEDSHKNMCNSTNVAIVKALVFIFFKFFKTNNLILRSYLV